MVPNHQTMLGTRRFLARIHGERFCEAVEKSLNFSDQSAANDVPLSEPCDCHDEFVELEGVGMRLALGSKLKPIESNRTSRR